MGPKHADSGRATCLCTGCGILVGNKTSSQQSTLEMGSEQADSGQVTCPLSGCGISFSGSYEVPRHIRGVHEGERLSCPYLGCTFTGAKREEQLAAHYSQCHLDTGAFIDTGLARQEQNEVWLSNQQVRRTQGGQWIPNVHYLYDNSPKPITIQTISIPASPSPTTPFATGHRMAGIPHVGYGYTETDQTYLYQERIQPPMLLPEAVPRGFLFPIQFGPWNRQQDTNVNATEGACDGNMALDSWENEPQYTFSPYIPHST